MKKTFTLFTLISFGILKSQSPSLEAWTVDATNTTTLIALTNGTVATYSTAAGANTEIKVTFKNISTTNTYTYSVIRKDVVLYHKTPTDSAIAHFCFGDLGSCYDQFTFEPSGDFVVLGPGAQTNSARYLYTELDEATSVGYSEINYKLFNLATGKTGTDTLSFTFKYNLLAGVNENKGIIQNASDVYPNPTTNNADITVVLAQESSVKIQVYNSLGSLVYNGNEQQLSGKNKMNIDCTNFNSGLYFITVTAGNSKVTKRLVVNK